MTASKGKKDKAKTLGPKSEGTRLVDALFTDPGATSETEAESGKQIETDPGTTSETEAESGKQIETDPGATSETEAESGEEIEDAPSLSHEHLRGLVEALIFASDKPMSASELARIASAPVVQVKPVLVELKRFYEGRGLTLGEAAGGWLFRTHLQYAPFVRELTSERPVRLTRAQLDTLAITAYRQPITRPEIDDIRGVDSGAPLKMLLERDLVRILGKKDEPGRPLLYGTTTQFLTFFGLKSLKDLPLLREFTELSDESRKIAESELGEPMPAPQAADTGFAAERSADDPE